MIETLRQTGIFCGANDDGRARLEVEGGSQLRIGALDVVHANAVLLGKALQCVARLHEVRQSVGLDGCEAVPACLFRFLSLSCQRGDMEFRALLELLAHQFWVGLLDVLNGEAIGCGDAIERFALLDNMRSHLLLRKGSCRAENGYEQGKDA